MGKADLMTDDWVKTPEGNYRVLGVLNDVVYTDFRNDERDGMAFSDELVEPISLTLEALERNGFTCDENIAKLVERDDTNNILWSAKYSFFTGMIEVVNKITDEKVKVRCYSVHELQHIFRLLEIEKEIEL